MKRAAAELAYVPNPAALSLATQRGTRIVIGVGSPRRTLVVDEYLGRVVASAAKVCAPERIGVGLEPLWLNDRDPLAALAHDPTVHGIVLVNTTNAVLKAVTGRLIGRVVSIGIGSPTVPSIDVDTDAAAARINAAPHRVRTSPHRDGHRAEVVAVHQPSSACTHRNHAGRRFAAAHLGGRFHQ